LEDLLSIPKAMLAALKYYLSSEGSDHLDRIRTIVQTEEIDRIVFVGHSHNYYASFIPFYFINSRYQPRFDPRTGKNIKKDCLILESDEFCSEYDPKHLSNKTIFVLISMSGASPQIRESYEKLFSLRIKSQHIWTVTNQADSFLGKHTYLTFPVCAGSEEMLGTKTYVNTMLVLYLIARAFMGQKSITNSIEDEIRQLIFEIKFYGQDWEDHTKNLTEFLGKDYEFLYFIAKGSSLASAYQAALFSKTYTRTFAEGISMGLFMHGPFQIVDDSFRCVLIIGDEYSVEETKRLMDIITRRLGAGKLILVNNSRQLSALGRSNPNIFVFEHTAKNVNLAPIFEIIVLQFLILQTAKYRGVIQE
jgi:glucosamine 6-phosphate synthetase-like amidotransferase/phosphosugar isomerase protein